MPKNVWGSMSAGLEPIPLRPQSEIGLADPFGGMPIGGPSSATMNAIVKALRAEPMARKSVADPLLTGWTFKDYLPVHREMGQGDWRRVEQTDSVEVELPIRSLYASQKTVNPDFASVPDRPVYGADNPKRLPFVIKKNGQYFVQDGHHRITAQSVAGSQTAKVRLVDLDGTTQTDFPLIDRMKTSR